MELECLSAIRFGGMPSCLPRAVLIGVGLGSCRPTDAARVLRGLIHGRLWLIADNAHAVESSTAVSASSCGFLRASV